MISSRMQEATKRNISLIIDALIEIIIHPEKNLKTSLYYSHKKERNIFLVYIYLYKLMLNNNSYLSIKYKIFKSRVVNKKENDFQKYSNIKAFTELELLLKIKEKITKEVYYYNEKDESIYFNDDTWIDTKWLLPLIILMLDNTSLNDKKEINICYAIPNKEVLVFNPENKDKYLSNFTYYNIWIKQQEKNISENSILIIKNAAINYLKHLKRYKYGYESAESYQVFYNLLTKECAKQGFSLQEEIKKLNEINIKDKEQIASIFDDQFAKLPPEKQTKCVENAIWKWSNDLNLLDQTNIYIDQLLDLITNLDKKDYSSYKELKTKKNYDDIVLIYILSTMKFLLLYTKNSEEIDYSLLNLEHIKPKYMSTVCSLEEQDLMLQINTHIKELEETKKNMRIYKEERGSLNKVVLGRDKYQSELERCVENINRASIKIATLNAKISSLTRKYDNIREKNEQKYNNSKNYKNNYSLIQHMINSILGCNFYLKNNNQESILQNNIIFEDYEKTDTSFYLEISIYDLQKISDIHTLNSVEEQIDLPKLA